jgi:TonB family protein
MSSCHNFAGRFINFSAKVALSLALAGLYAQPRALAQCGSGYVGLNGLVAHPYSALVFVGSVVSVTDVGAAPAQAVTFDVNRVWKGGVRERMVIYQMLPVGRGGERRLFQPGKYFLVVAHRLNAGERNALGITDNEDAFGTDACADGSYPVSILQYDAKPLAPGSAPVDRQMPPPVRGGQVVQAIRIRDVAPVYPDDARASGIRGSVIVEVRLDETGKVTHASVLRRIPFFDQAAIDCVMKWEFLPALFNGTPQATIMTVVVTFPPERR